MKASAILGPAWQELIADAIATLGTLYPATRGERERTLDELDDLATLERLDDRFYEFEETVSADELIDAFVWAHESAFFE